VLDLSLSIMFAIIPIEQSAYLSIAPLLFRKLIRANRATQRLRDILRGSHINSLNDLL
jgi:hypothetical protein